MHNYNKLNDVRVMLAEAIERLRSIQARIAVGVSPEGVADTEMVLVPARASKGMIEECFDTNGWDSDDYAYQEMAYRRWMEAAVIAGDGYAVADTTLMLDENAALKERLEKAGRVIAFYADPATWWNDETSVNRQEIFDVPAGEDLGSAARRFLEEAKKAGYFRSL